MQSGWACALGVRATTDCASVRRCRLCCNRLRERGQVRVDVRDHIQDKDGRAVQRQHRPLPVPDPAQLAQLGRRLVRDRGVSRRGSGPMELSTVRRGLPMPRTGAAVHAHATLLAVRRCWPAPGTFSWAGGHAPVGAQDQCMLGRLRQSGATQSVLHTHCMLQHRARITARRNPWAVQPRAIFPPASGCSFILLLVHEVHAWADFMTRRRVMKPPQACVGGFPYMWDHDNALDCSLTLAV